MTSIVLLIARLSRCESWPLAGQHPPEIHHSPGLWPEPLTQL